MKFCIVILLQKQDEWRISTPSDGGLPTVGLGFGKNERSRREACRKQRMSKLVSSCVKKLKLSSVYTCCCVPTAAGTFRGFPRFAESVQTAAEAVPAEPSGSSAETEDDPSVARAVHEGSSCFTEYSRAQGASAIKSLSCPCALSAAHNSRKFQCCAWNLTRILVTKPLTKIQVNGLSFSGNERPGEVSWEPID